MFYQRVLTSLKKCVHLGWKSIHSTVNIDRKAIYSGEAIWEPTNTFNNEMNTNMEPNSSKKRKVTQKSLMQHKNEEQTYMVLSFYWTVALSDEPFKFDVFVLLQNFNFESLNSKNLLDPIFATQLYNIFMLWKLWADLEACHGLLRDYIHAKLQ